MKKRLLSILLAALMIVSLLPTMAFAADDPGTITELNTLLTGATSGATIKLTKDFKWTAASETFSY